MGRQGGGRCGAMMEGARPTAAMVALQFVFSALQIFIKLALNDGMDARVLVAYRFMFAAAFLCPIAFVVERYARRARACTPLQAYSMFNCCLCVRACFKWLIFRII